MEVTVKKVEITLPEVDMALLKELAKENSVGISGRKEVRYRGKGLEEYQGRKNTQSEKRRRYVSTNPWLTHVPIGIHHEF